MTAAQACNLGAWQWQVLSATRLLALPPGSHTETQIKASFISHLSSLMRTQENHQPDNLTNQSSTISTSTSFSSHSICCFLETVCLRVCRVSKTQELLQGPRAGRECAQVTSLTLATPCLFNPGHEDKQPMELRSMSQ